MHGHKEHEHREHRETGGRNDAEGDLKDKPANYTSGAKKVQEEAEERKHGGKARHKRAHGGGMKHGEEHHHPSCKCKKCHGGRAERAHGGHIVHHEKPEHMKHAKHVGHVEGQHSHHRADRAPRKSGGRTGADSHPFSSARAGSPPPGHKVEDMD